MNAQIQVKVAAVLCDESKVKSAGPGENLRVRISGIEEEEIMSGFVLSSVGMVLPFPNISLSFRHTWLSFSHL